MGTPDFTHRTFAEVLFNAGFPIDHIRNTITTISTIMSFDIASKKDIEDFLNRENNKLMELINAA
jgi:hypothetical protein